MQLTGMKNLRQRRKCFSAFEVLKPVFDVLLSSIIRSVVVFDKRVDMYIFNDLLQAYNMES